MIQSFKCKDTQALYEGKIREDLGHLRLWPNGNYPNWMQLKHWLFLKPHRAISLKHSKVIEMDNTVFALMISGASASSGLKLDLSRLRLLTTTKGIDVTRPVNRMRPVHPGEILREDYLAPLQLSVNALAVALGVPATRIHEIVKERRAVTADTAARLAKHFGGDAASWLIMQANYDLKTLPTLNDIERQVSVRQQPAA